MPKKYSKKVYELAIFFARIWGVAETLEPLSYMEIEKVRDKMIEWAGECIDSREENFVEFFLGKMKEEFSLKY